MSDKVRVMCARPVVAMITPRATDCAVSSVSSPFSSTLPRSSHRTTAVDFVVDEVPPSTLVKPVAAKLIFLLLSARTWIFPESKLCALISSSLDVRSQSPFVAAPSTEKSSKTIHPVGDDVVQVGELAVGLADAQTTTECCRLVASARAACNARRKSVDAPVRREFRT